MSNVLNKLHEADQTPLEEWYLRTDDGSIYGPVNLSVMRDWAIQSRVAPGDEISADRTNWIRAESVPELKMEWVAELPDGSSYGPFNVLAVPNLHKSGVIPDGAALLHPASGKKVKVAELLQPDKAEEKESPQLNPELEQELKTLRRKHDAVIEHSAKREKELKDQILRLTSDLDDARYSMEKLKTENNTFSDQIMSLQSNAESSKDELAGALERLKQLNEHYEQLKEESARQMEELDTQNASFMTEKQQLQDITLNVEEDKVHAQRVIEQLKENLDETGRSAEELQRKLEAATAELNDMRKMAAIETDNLKRKVTELERKFEESGHQLQNTAGKLTEKSAELESSRQQTASVQEKLSREIQHLQQTMKSRNDSFDAELTREKQKGHDLSVKLEQAREDVKADSSVLAQTRERIAKLEQELKGKEEFYSEDRKRLQGALLTAEDAGKAMAEKIQSLEGQLSKDASGLNQTIAALQSQLEIRNRESEKTATAASIEINALKESAAGYARTGKELQSTLSARSSELDAIRSRLSEADNRAASLTEQLAQAARTVESLTEKEKSLEVTLHSEREGMTGREQRLKDELALTKTRIAELDKEVNARTVESSRLTQQTEQTNRQIEELRSALAARETELRELRTKLQSGTESLRRTVSEKEADASRLNGELSSLRQASHETEHALRKLQTENRQLQEESTDREKELRAQVHSASEHFNKMRESSDRQISALQTAVNELKASLESARTDNSQLTSRLENTLSSLKESERTGGKQKHSMESKIEELESSLVKTNAALDKANASLHKTAAEASKNEQTLRTTVRMLEKRDIAGRKHIRKFEGDIKELEEAKRILISDNSTLVEEVKDAVAQLKLLRRQVEPLNRKLEAQEELIKHRIPSRPGTPAARTEQQDSRSLSFSRITAAIGENRRVLTAVAAFLIVVTVSAVIVINREKKPAEPKPDTAAEVQGEIPAFRTLTPDLSLPPASELRRVSPPVKAPGWQAVNVANLTAEYGEYELELSFDAPAFSSGLSLTGAAQKTIENLLAKYADTLKKYRIVVSGLSEKGYAETGGHAVADYSLRIRRADAVRSLLLTDSRINPRNVFTVAGDQTDPSRRSVTITFLPMQ